MDFLFPCRERATSREHIMDSNGPFTEERCTTTPGFFSALISRGITFRTECGHYGPTFFPNLAAWMAFCELPTTQASLKKNRKFLCDPQAYGMPQMERGPQKAAGYWELSQHWPLFLARWHGKIPFREMLNWVQDDLHLSEFGELTSYLFTADFVYCNLVQQPTAEEVAKVIVNLGKAGLKGIHQLGY